MNETVLITGCSSGFGKLTAQTLHREGWKVAATMRSPEKETELADGNRMLVLKLDVTDTASVAAHLAATRERFGGVDAVVNNARYGGHGLFEQTGDEDVRATSETNVFGPRNVMREALPANHKWTLVTHRCQPSAKLMLRCRYSWSAVPFHVLIDLLMA